MVWLPRHVGTCSCQLLEINIFFFQKKNKNHQILRKNHQLLRKTRQLLKVYPNTNYLNIVPTIRFPIMTFRNAVCYTKSLCVFLFRQVKTLAIQIVFFLFTMAFITTHWQFRVQITRANPYRACFPLVMSYGWLKLLKLQQNPNRSVDEDSKTLWLVKKLNGLRKMNCT